MTFTLLLDTLFVASLITLAITYVYKVVSQRHQHKSIRMANGFKTLELRGRSAKSLDDALAKWNEFR